MCCMFAHWKINALLLITGSCVEKMRVLIQLASLKQEQIWAHVP